jgi:hypothetical protein
VESNGSVDESVLTGGQDSMSTSKAKANRDDLLDGRFGSDALEETLDDGDGHYEESQG